MQVHFVPLAMVGCWSLSFKYIFDMVQFVLHLKYNYTKNLDPVWNYYGTFLFSVVQLLHYNFFAFFDIFCR